MPGQPYMPRRSGKATAGMWLGIVSIFPGAIMNWVGILLGILGIVFSAIALNEMRNIPHQSGDGPIGSPGRGKAIAGIVCSIVGIVLSTLFLIYILQNYDIHSFTPTRK